MDRIDLSSLYRIGKHLNSMGQNYIDTSSNSILIDFYNAKYVIDNLLKGVPIQLKVSLSALKEINNLLDEFESDYFRQREQGNENLLAANLLTDTKVPAWRFRAWRRVIDNFEIVFYAEMADFSSYLIPRKGIYDTASLIDRADESFPSDLIITIPPMALHDWRSAGRCLALNLSTAAGFHVVRAVEAMLQEYFKQHMGKEIEKRIGWHHYLEPLEALSKKNESCPSKKTLSILRQMKDDYRNPVVHPHVNLTTHDARILFNNGESAIVAMAQEIQSISGVSVSKLASLFVEDQTNDEE